MTEIILNGTKEEKNNLIIALINSGYTVRLVEKTVDKKKIKVVEYWKNEQI